MFLAYSLDVLDGSGDWLQKIDPIATSLIL